MIDSLSQIKGLGGRGLGKEGVSGRKGSVGPRSLSLHTESARPVPTPLPSRGLAKSAGLPSHLQPHLWQVGDHLTWSSVELSSA